MLLVGQGSLYPALHKLEQQGWIEAEWGESDNNRRAKYYTHHAGGAARPEAGDCAMGAPVRRHLRNRAPRLTRLLTFSRPLRI